MWLPDVSLLDPDLECQRKLVNDHNANNVGDCVQLSSDSGLYRILNQTNTTSYSEGSLMDFQCLHTPYEVDPLFTTECQAGQWNPHPRDICGQGVTVVEYYGKCLIINIHEYLNFIMYSTHALLHLWEQ